ncbi:unnamed protein product [Orchesella dallaii]|uniref:RAP domain-containing protein n=1 Tax=Orchesella dallaii TaxID=48710 RepID=A0ABP1QYY6_9HEXA
MHRETLSRGFLFSHNLMGKSVIQLNCSRGIAAAGGKPSLAVFSRATDASLSSRCFHLSLQRNAQSFPRTIMAEAKAKSGETTSVEDQGTSASRQKPSQQQPKQFNISAKAILNTHDDEGSIPSMISATPIATDPDQSPYTVSSRTLLDSRIYSSRSVEELLNLSDEQELTLRHACMIISRLGSFSYIRKDAALSKGLQKDDRFLRIFNLIQRGNHSQFPHTLLHALTGLQKLGFQNSEEVSKLLEQELRWSMRRCPLRFLAKSVRILHENEDPETSTGSSQEDSAAVLPAAIKVLNRRWIEAITGSDFISLFQIIELFAEEIQVKIEDRAADVAHQFTPSEMVKLFIVLGNKKRRPTPLLRAIAYHYSKAEHKAMAKDLIDLIYALNELTFADPILMNRICTDLAEELSRVKTTTLISSLMISLGQMRYKNKEILFAVDDWIMKHLDRLRPFDYAAWLQAVAMLNHESENLQTFCKKAAQVLSQSIATSPTEWVNIVHSFVLLNHHTPEILASVLKPSFVESIEALGLKSIRHKLKLLNINFIASQTKDFKGSLLPQDKVTDWTTGLVMSGDEKLSKLAVDSLASFLTPTKYLEQNVQLDCGVYVDAVCYLDNKSTPVALESAKTKPSSVHKVAFVVEGYPLTCLGLKHPTGQALLNVRMLEAQNFLVVTVPYTEFGTNEKLIRRVQYLEQKLKTVSQKNEGALPANSR